MIVGFCIVTLGFGGLFAGLAGRAIALTWRSRWQIPAAILLLALVVRFLHYVMLREELLSGSAYAGDFITLLVIAWFSFAWTRRRQMQKQYGWLLAS